jgi:hypothetical protein
MLSNFILARMINNLGIASNSFVFFIWVGNYNLKRFCLKNTVSFERLQHF